jgi:phospholipid transport system substrate-binding protein
MRVVRGSRALLLGFVALAPDRAAAADGDATRVVAALHQTMKAVVAEAAPLGFEGRYAKLEPAIRAAYDLPFMSQRVLGRYWRKLDAAQKAKLVDAFTRLNVATYAARLREPSDDRFEIRAEEPADHGTVVVRTAVVSPDGEEISLTYRMRPTAEGPRVIDVFYKGTVSEVALRRSEYVAVFERDGFDGLLATLEQKVSDYRSGIVPED